MYYVRLYVKIYLFYIRMISIVSVIFIICDNAIHRM